MRLQPKLPNCRCSSLRPHSTIKDQLGRLPNETVTKVFEKSAPNLISLLDLQLNHRYQGIVARILQVQQNRLKRIPGCMDFPRRIADLELRYRHLPLPIYHIVIAKELAREIRREFELGEQLPARPMPAYAREYAALQNATQEELDRSIDILFEAIQKQLSLQDLPTTADAKRTWLNAPENQEQLMSIELLTLQDKALRILPLEMDRLKRLKRLSLAKNHLTGIFNIQGRLRNFDSLNLNDNQLLDLSDELGQLTRLITLQLSHNFLRALPRSLTQLTQLNTLYLNGNQISHIPGGVKNFKALRVLDISGNLFNELPEGIETLTELQSLLAGGNTITRVRPGMGQLTRLHLLNLNHNQLTTLPGEMGRLGALSYLYLSNNLLDSLPEDMRQLRLKTLHLSGNLLRIVPRFIEQLTTLESLDLSHNQIESLPDGVGKLTRLGILRLSENQLRSVPPSMSHLLSMRELTLESNPLEHIPESVIRWLSKNETIVDYVNSTFRLVRFYRTLDRRESGLCRCFFAVLTREERDLINRTVLELNQGESGVTVASCIVDENHRNLIKQAVRAVIFQNHGLSVN